jgi:two-component system phosphate regulon response regulator PhoB
MDGRSILLVEDEYGAAEILQLILEVEGYKVASAPNGQAAWEQLASHLPDVLLTDFMMPTLNGAQLGLRVRATPRTARLPIIMMSGVSETEVRRHFDGYDEFLQKPFQTPAVLGVLQRVLAAHQRGRRNPDGSSAARLGLRWLAGTGRMRGAG